MKFGCTLIGRGKDASPDNFVRMAERAEALGMDSLWLSAHIVLPPQVKSDYVLVPGARHPPSWRECYWEPFTVLSFLAAHTTRVSLGTSILVLPMHNPFECAKQVAEVDQLSNGRFIFGIGVGWFEEEFEVLGQNFRNRGARMDDAIELMKKLWSDDPVTYKGRFYSCENASFTPKPVQRPHPPIWMAGASRPAYRRAARYADAFLPLRMPPEKLVELRRDLDAECDEFGRTPGSVKLCVTLPVVFQDEPGETLTQGNSRRIADGIKRYIDLGVEDFRLDFVPESVDNALEVMERFAQEVRPRL